MAAAPGPGSASAPARFVDPSALARIGNLELVAKRVVDGFINGLHRSPYLGFSVDFAEHRNYLPGDDIRRIDWRLYARTDRFHIKLYEAETNTNFMIALDVSGSMGFGSESIGKLEYAKFLAASLTYFASKQRDRVGLATFREDVEDWVPCSAKHLDQILHTLDRVEPKGPGHVAGPIRKVAGLLKRQGIVAVISDFYEGAGEVIGALSELKFAGQDVIAFHVLDAAELDFPFDRPVSFQDLESDERMPVIPRKVRDRYKGLLGDHREELRKRFARDDIDYVLVDTREPLDRVLFEFLSARMRRTRTR